MIIFKIIYIIINYLFILVQIQVHKTDEILFCKSLTLLENFLPRTVQ